MQRGSFFAPSPRLGLATVTSTTVFSMVLLPGIATLQVSDDTGEVLGVSTELQTEPVSVLAHTPVLATDDSKDLRESATEYTVQSGDTLSTIGERFLVNVEALAYVNEISTTSLLKPGQVLSIPPSDGLIHTVKTGETVSSIAVKYEVSPQAIVDFNYLEEPFVLHAGDELVVPEAKVPQEVPTHLHYASASQPSTGGLTLESHPNASGTGGFVVPAEGRFTQFFSWRHPAVDISNSHCGTPVMAADSGTITFADWWAGGGGMSLFVDHGNGYVTKYAHLSSFARTGGGVQKGEVIGYIGATGRAFGCHLHFIVEHGGRAINPLSVL